MKTKSVSHVDSRDSARFEPPGRGLIPSTPRGTGVPGRWGALKLGLALFTATGACHARPPISPVPGSTIKAVPISVVGTPRGGQAWDISLNPGSSGLTDALDIVGGVLKGGGWKAARWQYSPVTGATTLAALPPAGKNESGALAARFGEFGGFALVPNTAPKAPPPLVRQATHWVGNGVNAHLPYWASGLWEYSIVTDMGTGVMGGWQHQIPNNAVNKVIPWMLWRKNPAWLWTNPAPMKDAHACYWPGGAGPAIDLDPTPVAAPVFVYGSRVLGVSGDGQTQAGDWFRRVPGYQSTVFQHACLWNGTQGSFEDRHPYKPNWTNSAAYDVHGGFGSQIQVGMHLSHGNTTIRRALAWSGPAGSWTWKEMHPAGNWASEAWSGDGFVVGYTVRVNKGRAYGMVFDPVGTAHLELPDPPVLPGESWDYTYATGSTFIGPGCAFVCGYGFRRTSPTAGQEEPILWTIEPPSPTCYADWNGDGTVNAADQTAFNAAWASGLPTTDCNGDGTLTTEDKVCFAKAMLLGRGCTACPLVTCYDCDGDGTININDAICHATSLLFYTGPYDPQLDCNCDGVIDAADATCVLNLANSGQPWCKP